MNDRAATLHDDAGQQSGCAAESRYDGLAACLSTRRRLVEDGIAAFLASHYRGRVLEIVSYVAQGGKRLRGVLAILICEALGGQPEDALAAAVAVELAHAASLAHDDVLDADVERRGRPAVHIRYDVSAAILVPHLVVPHAILSAQRYGPAAINAIVEGWARVVAGQVRDHPLLNANHRADDAGGKPCRPAAARAEYEAIIRDKTGALFETAAALGAMAAGDDQHSRLARGYGSWLGAAFQIADDVTDLERRVHAPWLAVLGHGVPGAARSMHMLRRMIAAAGEEALTPAAISRARRLACGPVARCVALAASFPDSSQRPLLREFPAFAIDQIYAEVEAGS